MRRFLHERLYPRAIAGLPGLGTPEEFAAGFRDQPGSLRERAEQLVRRHVVLSSAAGFVSGVGGVLLLPITLPANLAVVAIVQMHMAASVAALAGRDPRNPAIREAIVGCLVGDNPGGPERTAEEEAFDRVGLKVAERGLNTLVTAGVGLFGWAGRAAASALVRRRLVRGIPILGGALGALSDGYVTRIVAAAALDTFTAGPGNDGGGIAPPSGDGLPRDVGLRTGASPGR